MMKALNLVLMIVSSILFINTFMYCLDCDILNVPVDVLRPQTIILFVCLVALYVMNRKELR